MVGSRKSPVPSTDDGFLRKVRKPLVEKKRRDRMNRSIDQLKLMIADSFEDSFSTSKMDKADILNLTVSHLQSMKKQQASISMATEAAAYSSGFKDCAKETIQFLGAAGVISPEALGQLNNHLHSVFEKKSKTGSTKECVSMPTEIVCPHSPITPPLPSTSPQHYSTPMPGASLRVKGRNTPVLGISHLLNGSSFSSMDSPYSSKDSCDSGYSAMDLSRSSFGHVSGVLGGVSSYDSGLGNIMQEENPWRPW